MKKEDLIKKLEKIEFPQIEIPSHKRRLKMILMDWKYGREKRTGEIFAGLKRILIPLGTVAVIFLIALLISNLIVPQYSFAEVQEIALADPQIKEFVEGGAELKDIKIIKNKAYVLVSPKEEFEEEETALETGAIKTKEEFPGVLVEINLKEKEVTNIEKVTLPISPLTEEEKMKVGEIIKNPEILKIGEPEIEEIKPALPSPQKLIKKDKKVEILSEKRATVIYRVGKNQWEGKVNLNKEKLESLNFLGEIKD